MTTGQSVSISKEQNTTSSSKLIHVDDVTCIAEANKNGSFTN